VARVPPSAGGHTHADVLEHVDVAIVSTDARGLVVTWNTRATGLYGWTAEEAVGRSFAELLAPQGEEAAVDQIVASVRAGRAWQGAVRVSRRDGSVFTAFVRQCPLHDAAGRVVGIIGAALDAADPELARAVRTLAAASSGDGRRSRTVLSPRERQILTLLARGLTGEQIAERLVLSPETIRTHVRNAREKLGASTRVEAVTRALRANEIHV
jgi:PAS domain S-box-containing protein